MLIHLQPEQVSKHWEVLAPFIGVSVPANMTGKDGMASVLRAALLERMQVWVYQDGERMAFIVSTAMTSDPVTGVKWLLIYSLSAVSEVKKDMWSDAFETLKKFAKSRGAVAIRAYSDDKRIIKYVASQGANTGSTLIEFPI